MQWSGDMNAGFSGVDPEHLYMPPIVNPVYHYESLNVRSEERLPYSFLNFNKRVIKIRKKSHAFGRGDFKIVASENMKVLAFTRQYNDEIILCIFNLSREPTFFHLDLSHFSGLIPVEMSHDTRFPRIKADRPYFFTLTGHRYMWFRLVTPEKAPAKTF